MPRRRPHASLFHARLRVAPAVLAAAAGACAGCDDAEPARDAPTRRDAPTSAAPAAPPPAAPAPAADAAPRPWFVDAAPAAGIDVVVWCGSERDTKRTIVESIGQGAAWLDDDLDGRLDLYVVNGSTLERVPDPPPTDRFYRARADGGFDDVTESVGLADPAWGNGVAAADFDNDGDTDLFVTQWGPHRLFENSAAEEAAEEAAQEAAEEAAGSAGPVGAGPFRDVARAAGVDLASDPPRWGTGAAFGDIDNDGFLDLYVAHYLAFDPDNPPNGGRLTTWKGIREAYYGPTGCLPQGDVLLRNLGDGTFVDVSEASGTGRVEPAYSLGVLFTDYDLDGDADLYVANDSQPNYMFVNDGEGRFEERGDVLGLAYGEQGNAQAGMGVDAADWSGDGRDELLVTNFDDDVNTLYENRGRGFLDATARSGLAARSRNVLSWGCALLDFDHDGDRDAFGACGHVYPRAETDDPTTRYRQTNQLLLNVDGRFEDVSASAGPAFAVREVSRGAAFGDYDADGDVDVLVINLNRPPTLYRNDSPGLGPSIQVRLVGSRSNRDGIGARVTVRAGGRTFSAERRAGASFLSTNSPWLHFGLAGARTVDAIEVRWPSGATTKHGPFEVGAASHVVLRE